MGRRQPHRVVLLLAGGLIGLSLLPAAHASSTPPSMTEEDAVRQGNSVVAGHFSGDRTPFEHTFMGMQPDGTAAPMVIELVAHTFVVEEHLEGAPLPQQVSIHIAQAQLRSADFSVPDPDTRVVVSLIADRRVERPGYVVTHSKILDAQSDARLDELRAWVQEVRQPKPVPPEAIVDALGQARTEADALSLPPPQISEPGYDGAMEEDNAVGPIDPHARPQMATPGEVPEPTASRQPGFEAERRGRLASARRDHAGAWARTAGPTRPRTGANAERHAERRDPWSPWLFAAMLVLALLGAGYGYRRLRRPR